MAAYRVDINCQRKGVTARVTLVLGPGNVSLVTRAAAVGVDCRAKASPRLSSLRISPYTQSKVRVEPDPKKQRLRVYYETLYAAWGCQHWWPSHTRFEVIVGAYLTQNTSWKNVEVALRRLRGACLLSLAGIRDAHLSELEDKIRPAGYFRQKAARLKTFVAFVDAQYGGSLNRMFAQPMEKLRRELLALNGVGPETADSILLYAGQHPVFVVDTYTRRILERHAILPANADYEVIRELFERALSRLPGAEGRVMPTIRAKRKSATAHRPSRMSRAKRSPLAQIYNDMHGLIVTVGKNYCLKREARCEECPLRKFLPEGLVVRVGRPRPH